MGRKLTRRQTCCVILVSWVGSVGLSVPAGHFRVVNSYGYNCETHFCEEVFPESFKHYQNTYSVILFIINFALPLVIMAISYSLVRQKITEHIVVLKRVKDEQSRALSSVTQPSNLIDEIQQKRVIKKALENQARIEDVRIGVKTENMIRKPQRINGQNISTKNTKDTMELENDLLRMVYALVLTFIVCYIPYQVQFLMIEFNVKAFRCWPHRHSFSRLVFTLTCLPSALHPLFYGIMSKFYRKAFIKMIACRYSK